MWIKRANQDLEDNETHVILSILIEGLIATIYIYLSFVVSNPTKFLFTCGVTRNRVVIRTP